MSSVSVNKELVKRWAKALRSGKYAQGRRALRNKDNEYCCLGVLCDISKDILKLNWEPGVYEDEKGDFEIYTMERNGGVLPDSVWEYLGKQVDYKVQISFTNSKLPSSIIKSPFLNHYYLVTLNDPYGLSFEQIADILEEEFLT